MWSTRNLTMQGRIQISKTFIISQFLFITSSIHIPKKYIVEINRLIFKFIWKNKKERIKRTTLIRNKEKGGLKVPDFSIMIKAMRVAWLKKILSGTRHVWKKFFDCFLDLSNLDPQTILVSNYDAKWFLKDHNIPPFYYEVLTEFSKVGNTAPISKTQYLWYNKNFLIQGKPVFYKEFLAKGMCYTSDLFDNNGNTKPFSFWTAKGLKKLDFLY